MEIDNNSKYLILLGKRLTEVRTKRNLSYRALAQMCKVDHSQISKIEKGQVSIQLITLFELATALNVHPKELFDFDFNLEEDKN